MAVTLAALVDQVPPQTERRVAQTRTRLDPSIRQFIRQETGLQLARQASTGSGVTEYAGVPIVLLPGLPERLEKWLAEQPVFDDGFAALLWVSRYRYDLERVVQAAPGMMALLAQLANSRGDLPDPAAVAKVSAAAHTLLGELDKQKPLAQILGVNEDVLGVYHFGNPSQIRIELYWAVIGLVAQMLAVEVEALAGVVLAHELAHAYTHLGADIDGFRWPTDLFDAADLEITEGLAQYYTARACRHLERQQPGVFAAYERLLTHQPSAYQVHRPWLENHSSEEVRSALLTARRNGIRSLVGFELALEQARTHLQIRRRRGDQPMLNFS